MRLNTSSHQYVFTVLGPRKCRLLICIRRLNTKTEKVRFCCLNLQTKTEKTIYSCYHVVASRMMGDAPPAVREGCRQRRRGRACVTDANPLYVRAWHGTGPRDPTWVAPPYIIAPLSNAAPEIAPVYRKYPTFLRDTSAIPVFCTEPY